MSPAAPSWAANGAPGGGFSLGLAEELELGTAHGGLSCLPCGKRGEGGVSGPVQSTLPGQGEPGPDCGRPFPRAWCPQDRYAVLGRHQCARRECPRCAGRCEGGSSCPAGLPEGHSGGEWAHRESWTAAGRIRTFGLSRCDRSNPGTLAGILGWYHAIVSPDPRRFPEDSDHRAVVRKVRQVAIRRARKWAMGVYAGVTIVHLYRGCENAGYTEWGPHAHLLLQATDVRQVAAWSELTGWVFKLVTSREGRFKRYVGRGIRKLICYELGHSAVIRGDHSITWFGELKTWKEPALEEEAGGDGAEEFLCRGCGGTMHELGLGYRVAPIDGSAEVTFEQRTACICPGDLEECPRHPWEEVKKPLRIDVPLWCPDPPTGGIGVIRHWWWDSDARESEMWFPGRGLVPEVSRREKRTPTSPEGE